MNKKKNWPLNISTFTFLDRCKIFWWLLTEKVWTAGEWVRRYEQKWSDYSRCPNVIAVSSGSAANELIALRRKHELEQTGKWPKYNKVVVAANTWISNVSPWINIGFEPVFIDAALPNLNVSSKDLDAILSKYDDIGTVFYTTLLGYSDDIYDLIELCKHYKVKLMLDNCESSFSWQKDRKFDFKWSFNNFVTSSTSCYFSHFTTSGTEMGLIFCQDSEEADWYRMARNHGMTRGLPEKYRNKEVDAAFDFYCMGSNYRTSNLAAYMALLDFDRAERFSREQRVNIAKSFYSHLDFGKFERPQFSHTRYYSGEIPLALPIIVSEKANRPDLINKVKGYLLARNVEIRPLIGGFLGFHTAFKKYNLNPLDFPRSVWLHNKAIYIGLHSGVTSRMAIKLAKELSSL